MIHVVCESDRIRVPDRVVDLPSFRSWTDDVAFPESGRVCFLKGEVWIDMSKEQLFSHNQVKMMIARCLIGLVLATRQGRYFGDGAFVSNVEADVSNQPDGCFVSVKSLEADRVRLVEGKAGGHVELEGSPDMVLEVVSDSSEEKETVVLRKAYAEAGIREYWLVDARETPPNFAILRLTRRGYSATRNRGGWVRSEVFDRWFRLEQEPGQDGFPVYRMESRPERPE